MKRLIPLYALAPLFIASAASGQEAVAPAGADDSGIDVESLIEQVAEDLGREFIIDPRARGVRGSTTNSDIDYESLLALLRVNDLVAIETADQILIIPEQISRSMPSPILQDDDSRVSDHTIVTRVIDIPEFPQRDRNLVARSEEPSTANPFTTLPPASAAQLVPVLRPMMPQSAMLGAITGTNQLVLVDRYDNVRRITAIIEEILEGLED